MADDTPVSDTSIDPQEEAAATGWRRMLSDVSDPTDTQGIQPATSPIDMIAGGIGSRLVRGAATEAGAAADKGSDLLRSTAEDYNASKGLPPIQSTGSNAMPVDPQRGARIAQAFDAMPHTPNDPATKKAYQALIDETGDQYKQLKDNGLQIEKIPAGSPNPYKNSQAMLHDVQKNNHIWYFPTEGGFGSDAAKDFSDHPLMQPTEHTTSDGEPMVANDVFRVVHDIYGHAKEGNTFGPRGEENAWLQHKQMYSPEAQKAMTTETRGQNSWVNYGPFGEANRANPAATTYADQKAGLLPSWAQNEGFKMKKASGGEITVGGSGDLAEAGTTYGYAGGGGVAVGASIDPIQGGNLNAYADGGNVADTAQPSNTTQVVSPSGEFGSVPNEYLTEALHPDNGYRIATPEDIAAYQHTQQYGGVGGAAKAAGNAALSSATFGTVPGIGSAKDIQGYASENPVSDVVGGILPYAVPGIGEAEGAGLAAKAARLATTVPRAIGEAGEAVKAASGLTGVGANALQYAAEGAIMQGQSEVSKMLLKDPTQSASNAVANEGLSALLGGALGAATGGIGKVADLWESKFGAKAGESIIDKSLPDIATQELQAGISIPASLKDALSGNQDAYNKVQVLQKVPETIAGKLMAQDVGSLYDQAEQKTLESLGASDSMVSKSVDNYDTGSQLSDAIKARIEAGKKVYGPIYDSLRGQYKQIPVTAEQKEAFAGQLTQKLSEAGIGGFEGSAESSAMSNLFKSLDKISDAEGIKNLNTGLNNAAKNPELQRLAAVAGPTIKDFESSVVQNHLTSIAEGSAPNTLSNLSSTLQKAIEAGSPEAAIEAAAHVEGAQGKYAQATQSDAQKAQALLGQRKTADAAFKKDMALMSELRQSIGLGRFKGTNGFIRSLDDKAPEQVLQRLSNKNRQDLIEVLQKEVPEAASILKNYHLNDQLHDAQLPGGGLNTKKFLNTLLDGDKTPAHIQTLMAGNPAVIQRLEAVKNILNAIPKDGNPSNSANMLNRIWSGKVGTLMGGAMGLGGGHVTGGILGAIGEKTISEIKPFLSYKTLQMRGGGTSIVPSNVKALYDYAKSVSVGHTLVNKSVNSLFNSNQALPDSKLPSAADRSKLDKYITQIRNNPNALNNTASNLRDILPDHMPPLSLQAKQAVDYLTSIKPHSSLGLPFDSKIPPSAGQVTEYNRQLDIAEQPLMAVKYMKEGSLTPNDLNTLKNVHPQMYQQLSQKIMGELPNSKSPVPYKTRLAMSLFVGQPLDSTMTPQAIISAQPLPPAQVPQGGAPGNKPKRSTSSLNKLSSQYKTPTQSADSDRSSRD